MKKINHRGTENTEGLYALGLPNLEAIRDDLINLMTKKLRAFRLKMRLRELGMSRLLSKKMSYLMGQALVSKKKDRVLHPLRLNLMILSAIMFFGIAPLHAGPINSNSAFSPHDGDVIWREQYHHIRVDQDPSGLNRHLQIRLLSSVLAYGFSEKVSGILVIPRIKKSLSFDSGANRIQREGQGLGDIRTVIKHRVYTKDQRGLSQRLGIFYGVKWPTGRNDQSDFLGRQPTPLQNGSGSIDLIFGSVWTVQAFGYEFDTDISYKYNTEADGFKAGDSFKWNVSYQNRVLPRRLPETGTPSFLYGVIEVEGVWKNKNEISSNKDLNSGGVEFSVSPGIQWVGMRWVAESSFTLPLVQNFNGVALEKRFSWNTGVRFRF